MIGARRQRVGDFMENRIANLLDFIQVDQLPREGDLLCRITARSESPAGVIKAECPVRQAVRLQQGDRQLFRIIQVQWIFPERMAIESLPNLATNSLIRNYVEAHRSRR